MNTEIQETIDKVIQWGNDKGITGPNGKGTIPRQTEKFLEEVEETRVALLKLASARNPSETWAALDEIEDGIGDTMVTLILLGEMLGIPIGRALNTAHGVISKRTGKMIDGVFVKDQ